MPLPVGLLGGAVLDDGGAGLRHAAVHPGAHAGQQGHAQGGPLPGNHGGNAAAIDIGQHLPPEGAGAPAAAGGHPVHGQPHVPKHRQAVHEGVGHPLHHRPQQVPLLMHSGQAKEHAPGLRIQMRRPLPHQIREIEQPVGPHRGQGRLLVHEDIRVGRHPGGGFLFRPAELIPEPFQGQAGPLGDPHHMPRAGHRAAEGVHPPGGIDGDPVGVGVNHAARADGGEGAARRDHAGAGDVEVVRVGVGSAHVGLDLVGDVMLLRHGFH